MSREEVINNWLVPSTPDKNDRQYSPAGRPLQGSKGIGRYAASKLGEDLLLETITRDGEKTTVYLLWKKFEETQYLGDVPILVESTQTHEKHGTCLTINMDKTHLEQWNKDKFEKLQYELKKLKSPVSAILDQDKFDIKLSIDNFPHKIGKLDETIEPYILFDLYDYKISGEIDEDGKGVLTYSSQKAPNIPTDVMEIDFGERPKCGELVIDIRVYDRDTDALELLITRGLKDSTGKVMRRAQAKTLLDAYSGIGVYRNGFRIRPLGDSDFDWLELNKRRINEPTRCIGINQVIGYVQIQSDYKSDLIEKSARDGLKENDAFDHLKKLTMKVIIELESRRFIYRRRIDSNRPTIEVERNLDKVISFQELKSNISRQLTRANVNQIIVNNILDIIDKEAEQKNKVIEDIRRVVAIYQNQITVGKIINVIHHQGRHAIEYFRNSLPVLKRRYEAFKKNRNIVNFDQIIQIINANVNNSDLLVDLFKKIEPLAAGRGKSKKTFKLTPPIMDVLAVFEKELDIHKIKVVIEGSENITFYGWDQDIRIIFTNLIHNSIYWLKEKNVSERKVTIQTISDGDTLDHIDYRDTGPGILREDIESEVIFEPDFSRKPFGTGLGLAIAGETAQRNNLRLKAIECDDGAHFILEPIIEEGQ